MSDPVFKGCTRPPLVLGVPLVPFIAFSAPMMVLGMWGLVFAPVMGFGVFFMILPVYFWMRIITKSDDQRLLQQILRFRMIIRQKNRFYWGGVASYSAYQMKR